MNFTRGTGTYNLNARLRRSILAAIAVIICCFAAPAWAGSGQSIVELSAGISNSASGTANHALDGGTGSSDLQTSNPSAFTGPSVNTIIGANTFYANGITGQGTVTANVEAGFIWNGHETLGHVSQYVNDASACDDPGTVGQPNVGSIRPPCDLGRHDNRRPQRRNQSRRSSNRHRAGNRP